MESRRDGVDTLILATRLLSRSSILTTWRAILGYEGSATVVLSLVDTVIPSLVRYFRVSKPWQTRRLLRGGLGSPSAACPVIVRMVGRSESQGGSPYNMYICGTRSAAAREIRRPRNSPRCQESLVSLFSSLPQSSHLLLFLIYYLS